MKRFIARLSIEFIVIATTTIVATQACQERVSRPRGEYPLYLRDVQPLQDRR